MGRGRLTSKATQKALGEDRGCPRLPRGGPIEKDSDRELESFQIELSAGGDGLEDACGEEILPDLVFLADFKLFLALELDVEAVETPAYVPSSISLT